MKIIIFNEIISDAQFFFTQKNIGDFIYLHIYKL